MVTLSCLTQPLMMSCTTSSSESAKCLTISTPLVCVCSVSKRTLNFLGSFLWYYASLCKQLLRCASLDNLYRHAMYIIPTLFYGNFSSVLFQALRYTSPGSRHSESATRLVANVVNVRSIASHFKPKIDAWSAAHEIISITPEQVSAHRYNYCPELHFGYCMSCMNSYPWVVILRLGAFYTTIFCAINFHELYLWKTVSFMWYPMFHTLWYSRLKFGYPEWQMQIWNFHRVQGSGMCADQGFRFCWD